MNRVAEGIARAVHEQYGYDQEIAYFFALEAVERRRIVPDTMLSDAMRVVVDHMAPVGVGIGSGTPIQTQRVGRSGLPTIHRHAIS